MIEKVSDFKDRFNEALSIRNMKPVELSEKSGISESTISQYRSGYAKPKDDKLIALSNALDINPVWLMGLNVEMEIEDIPSDIDESAKEAFSIMRQYENLPPEKKDSLRRYLQFLLSDV